MKTVAQVELDINQKILEKKSIREDVNIKYDKQERLCGRIDKRLEVLREIKAYLEFGPSEDFIKRELDRLHLLYEKTMDGYDGWIGSIRLSVTIDDAKAKARFRTEMGLKDLEAKIHTCEYILAS